MTSIMILLFGLIAVFVIRLVRHQRDSIRMHRFVTTKVMPPDFDDERAGKA